MSHHIRQEMLELQREIEQHEHAYYILHAPTIGDTEYDHLLKRLEALEEAHPEWADPLSPTQRVGSDLTNRTEAVPHHTPMLSLSNTYSAEEVSDFCRQIEKAVGHPLPLVAELKLDGVSISVIYEDGVFTQAVTRGDGLRGDDVTAAVRTIRSVPMRLVGEGKSTGRIEVRGEILLPWREFERINTEREAAGLPLFANPRNAVAGTIKQLSPRIVSRRRPLIYFYYLLSQDTPLPSSHYARLGLMSEWGLPVSPHAKLCQKPEEVLLFISQWETKRHTLDVATDGIVIKVDDYSYHEEIGYTAKAPKWAIAYKYPAEAAASRLTEVSFQVGRTGVVTPVAHIEPVHLSGTTVQRASLHNIDIIRQLDLHIGDIVYVEKGGEIIPKITGVKERERAPLFARRVEMPEHCPACGTTLEKEEDEAATYCPNDMGCPPQIRGRIEHFASRKAMNINIGPETIRTLNERGLLSDVSDLYRLRAESLQGIPLFADKSIGNLLESIEKSKQVPYARVLYALGIRHVGESVAALLAREFPCISLLTEASEEALTQIEGIGPAIAHSIREYCSNPGHVALLGKLREDGVRMEGTPPSAPLSTTLKGETVVISGTFHTLSREELKTLIQQHGGKVSSGITGKTTLFLAGEKVGPSKLKKVQDRGIRMLSEEQFFALYPLRSPLKQDSNA